MYMVESFTNEVMIQECLLFVMWEKAHFSSYFVLADTLGDFHSSSQGSYNEIRIDIAIVR